jgi:polysaccharide transporter, PST family
LSAIFITKRLFIFSVGVCLGTEKAGFLNIAFRLVDTVWAITATAVAQVLLPTLSRLQHDRARLLNAYRTSLKLALAILFPVFAGLGVLAPDLISLLFGDKWEPAAPYALILSLLTFVQVPRLPATPLLGATGHLRDLSYISMSVLAYMVVAIALTRLPDAYAALAVWSGGELITFVGTSLALRRRIAIPVLDLLGDMVAPLAASTAMIVSVQIARVGLPADLAVHWRLPELALLASGSYMLVMLLFGRRHVGPVVGMARLLLTRH